MITTNRKISANGMFLFQLAILNVIILEAAFTGSSEWYLILLFAVPLLLMTLRTNINRSKKEQEPKTGSYRMIASCKNQYPDCSNQNN